MKYTSNTKENHGYEIPPKNKRLNTKQNLGLMGVVKNVN